MNFLSELKSDRRDLVFGSNSLLKCPKQFYYFYRHCGLSQLIQGVGKCVQICFLTFSIYIYKRKSLFVCPLYNRRVIHLRVPKRYPRTQFFAANVMSYMRRSSASPPWPQTPPLPRGAPSLRVLVRLTSNLVVKILGGW